MFSCCDLCYAKYINEDGTIDPAGIEEYQEKLVAAGYDRVEVTDHDKLCRCGCHEKGKVVLH
jgi:hypothetical protein